jgi:hypothetical protein
MSLTLRVFATILLAALSAPGSSWAQTKNKPPDVKNPRIAAGIVGTLVKKPPVITDDDISLLAEVPTAKSAETPKAEAAMDHEAGESAGVSKDPENLKVKNLALAHQIKEKQMKIELLMRIFATDEQSFLRDSSGQLEDEETRAKRKFEQEELLQQTKEIAELRSKLDLLSSEGDEKAAPAKP